VTLVPRSQVQLPSSGCDYYTSQDKRSAILTNTEAASQQMSRPNRLQIINFIRHENAEINQMQQAESKLDEVNRAFFICAVFVLVRPFAYNNFYQPYKTDVGLKTSSMLDALGRKNERCRRRSAKV
jgi:hypothetical protein